MFSSVLIIAIVAHCCCAGCHDNHQHLPRQQRRPLIVTLSSMSLGSAASGDCDAKGASLYLTETFVSFQRKSMSRGAVDTRSNISEDRTSSRLAGEKTTIDCKCLVLLSLSDCQHCRNCHFVTRVNLIPG